MAARSWLGRGARWLALGAAAVLTGCATAPTALFAPGLPPRAEALAYLPEAAPLVAVIRTDADAPGLGRLRGSGILNDLIAGGRANGVVPGQMRSLLGHDLVVGLPYVGAAPL